MRCALSPPPHLPPPRARAGSGCPVYWLAVTCIRRDILVLPENTIEVKLTPIRRDKTPSMPLPCTVSAGAAPPPPASMERPFGGSSGSRGSDELRMMQQQNRVDWKQLMRVSHIRQCLLNNTAEPLRHQGMLSNSLTRYVPGVQASHRSQGFHAVVPLPVLISSVAWQGSHNACSSAAL